MYLITGGAGFIGSNIAAALDGRNERVVVCDRLRAQTKWKNLAKRELEDVVPPERLFDEIGSWKGTLKAVIHLGAISSTSELDADKLLANNFHLSRDLWSWCAENGIPFIYASSAATYGDGEEGFDDDVALDYLAKLRPANGYAWAKHLFDRWVARRMAENGPQPPKWAGLKFFNVYGPHEYHKGAQASVVWQLFRQVQRTEKAKLFQSYRPDYEDGGQLRDFVHVDDCVDVVLWLLDSTAPNGLYNVGTGQARSFFDLAQALFAAMEQAPNIEFIPMPDAIRDHYQYLTEAKLDRLRAAGYDKDFIGLEDGVARYVRDYLMTSELYR